jgi:RNA polymerase sigma-70 factor (ECF subfamily)
VDVPEVQPHASSSSVSFQSVYDEFFAFVYRNARRLGVPQSAADDVTQDVFLVIHRRLGEYDGRASLRSWVYGVLVNTVRGYRRTARRKHHALVGRENLDDFGAAATEANPERRAQGRQEMEMFLSLLGELNDEQRELIVLADLEQLNVSEIAACTGTNVNTLQSRLRVARETLRSKLARRLLSELRKERT